MYLHILYDGGQFHEIIHKIGKMLDRFAYQSIKFLVYDNADYDLP